MDGYSVSALVFLAAFSAFVVGLVLDASPSTSYDKFASDCTKSTIQTQYAEQQGRRVMVVQCERAK